MDEYFLKKGYNKYASSPQDYYSISVSYEIPIRIKEAVDRIKTIIVKVTPCYSLTKGTYYRFLHNWYSYKYSWPLHDITPCSINSEVCVDKNCNILIF